MTQKGVEKQIWYKNHNWTNQIKNAQKIAHQKIWYKRWHKK